MLIEHDSFFDNAGRMMHYVDQGEGALVVMLHGNPTWSYYYRDLARQLAKTHRVIVPDHIGMGLSDKPQGIAYDLTFHIENLTRLIDHLQLEDITLIVHDWGGPIGFGYAVTHPSNVAKIVIMNSAAFFDENVPLRIRMCRSVLGDLLVRQYNLFAKGAASMATVKALPAEVKEGYLLPYGTYEDRVGIRSFLADIPLEGYHPTRQVLDTIESKLPEITADILLVWGARDFCFTEHFLDRWLEFFEDAQVKVFEQAGHYVLEDAFDEALAEIEEFIR
ncbi:MAG: alpha/beta fold hydrolase [Coriobacteriia bacterium]|nr:alpha/beta fold hydrolase [Coriobacteriia bacterium]